MMTIGSDRGGSPGEGTERAWAWNFLGVGWNTPSAGGRHQGGPDKIAEVECDLGTRASGEAGG